MNIKFLKIIQNVLTNDKKGCIIMAIIIVFHKKCKFIKGLHNLYVLLKITYLWEEDKMKKTFKRIVALLAVLCLFAGMSVSAAWEFAGYDTTVPGDYQKLYNEKLNGSYTSKHKSEPVAAEDVEWKFEGYEAAYPHTGYERLYLEGNRQNAITRLTDLYPQWDVRFRDYMWEVCGDHEIWERQQTKINNKTWAWDFGNPALGIPDSDVFVPTGRYAKTTDEWKIKGIANYDLDGNFVFDQNGEVYNEYLYTIYEGFEMPDYLELKENEDGTFFKNALGHYELADNSPLHITKLSEINGEDGSYVMSDEDIAEILDLTYTKYTTGPTYYGENATKDVADMYVANKDAGWYWDDDVEVVLNNGVIRWTKEFHENAEPYCYYQYLIVNGLVFDGRGDTPEIKRYTNGKANPKVEWKYESAEDEWPYEVYQVKYVEDNFTGKMVVGLDDSGDVVVRYPTGEYANSHFVVTDTEIQVWITDNYGSRMIWAESRVNADFGDEYEGYTNGANLIEE